MNFKGFLKKTGFLNEDGNPTQQDIDNFKKNAYKRVFKYRGSKANEQDPDKCWRAVLNKASYKLTKNSSEDNRNAVKIAKGAIQTAKARFNDAINDKLTDEEKEEFAKTTTDKIRNHAEDWTQKDVEELKKKLQSNSKFDQGNIQYLTIFNLQKGKGDDTFLDGLSEEQQKELFEAMKELESDEGLDEKVWKDKTIEDLDELNDDDIAKIKGELAKKGIEITDKKDIEKLIKDGKLSPEDIEALDNLLNTESTPPAEPNPPAETGRPETANRDHQRQMEEMEKKRKLEKKLKDNEIPVKEDGTPDFDNPKTLEKINELMINGDDELYKEYILAKGGNQSDLAKQIAQDTAKENELIRTDIENRTARREAEKDQQKAICNIALALDVIFSFLAGKTQDGFSTLANKRVQAKALETQLKTAFNDDTKFQETQKEIETAHNAELENITKKEKQRLSEIERDRQTPRGTPAFKRKAMELSQEYDKKRAELQEKSKKIDQAEKVQTSIKNLLRAKQVGTEITADNQELRDIYPIDTANNETPEAYTERLNSIIQSDTFDQDLEKKENEIQTEIENFNAEADNLEKDFNKALNDLEADPEVQSEFKDANAAYEFKKANIQAEMNVLRAKEEKRFKDRISVNKQIFEEREKLLKNVATLSQWSSDPKEVMRTEFLNFNRKAKSMYESRGLTFNEDNDPALSDNDKVLKEYFDKFEQNMNDRIKQQQQAQQGKGKKDDETGGQKPQRPPFGGHKPNETDGGEGGKTQNTGEGKKQLTQLQGEFNTKPKARKRLDAFLKEQGLDPSDPNVDDEELQDAIKEFKTKQFPEPANLNKQELENLGITDADIPDDLKTTNGITDLGKYAEYLKDKNNAAALEKLKEELGFPKSVGFNKQKLKTPEKADEINKLNLEGTISANGKDYDLKSLTPEALAAIQGNVDAKAELDKKLQSVKALQGISQQDKLETESEIETGSEGDPTQDPEDAEDKKKLSRLSLKTLWTKLNKAGISIRALPGYDPKWSVEEKKKAIIDYIKAHKSESDKWVDLITESKNLNHRKTAFKRLNEMSQAQKRASDRRTLRKFSELLVKDFRDFT